MQDLLWLIRKTLISTFKNIWNVLLYFVFPVLGIVLATLIHGGSKDVELNMGIVNEDSGQAITQDAVKFIGRLDSVQISEIQESDVNNRIASGELDAAVIFPAGFAASLKSGNPEAIRIVSIKGVQVTGYVKSYLNQYIDNVSSIGKLAGGNESKFDSLYADYGKADFRLTKGTVEDKSVNHSKAYQSVGYLIILMLFSATNLSGILIKERENRTYHRVISSPVAARTYVMSNIVVNLAMMIVQIAVTLLIMYRLFHIDPGISFWSMFMILVLFALVAVSLSLAIVAFSKSSIAAGAMQSILIMPSCLLAGCMFPLETMPDVMHKVAYFLPQYWLLDTLDKLQLGSRFGSLYVNLLILFAFAVTLSLIASYKVSRSNDTRSFV